MLAEPPLPTLRDSVSGMEKYILPAAGPAGLQTMRGAAALHARFRSSACPGSLARCLLGAGRGWGVLTIGFLKKVDALW